MNSVNIISYNCQGCGPSRFQYMGELLKNNDLLLIQEHWLHESQFVLFTQNLKDVTYHGICGMQRNVLCQGRSYGGCAIIWHRRLLANIRPIPYESSRICAVKVERDKYCFVLCNVYMPPAYSPKEKYLDEFHSVCSDLNAIINLASCSNVIIGGDFNTNFDKPGGNVRLLETFMNRNPLYCGLNHSSRNVKFTFESKVHHSTSVIDHFIFSSTFFDYINVYRSLHELNNLSDHCPLAVELMIPSEYSKKSQPVEGVMVNWCNATNSQKTDYKVKLDDLLGKIEIPWSAINCKSVNCKKHIAGLQFFHDAIIDCCLSSAQVVISVGKKRSRKKYIPGWSVYVEKYKKEALFWHTL